MSDAEQYAKDAAISPQSGSNSLTVLYQLAEEQAAAENVVVEAEAALLKAKQALREISERRLPETMEELNMETFKTTTGLHVVINNTVRAGISEERAAKAFAWLRENNHDALIKRVVSKKFGAGQDKLAEAALKKLGKDAEDKASVHASTLAAFVREQLAKGANIPLELLGVHQQKVAVITRAGEDKKSRKGRKDDGKAPF